MPRLHGTVRYSRELRLQCTSVDHIEQIAGHQHSPLLPGQVRNCARTWTSPHAAPQTTAARREHDLTRGRADARAQSDPLAPGRWSESTGLSPQPHPTGRHPQSTGSDAQPPSRRDLTQGRTRTSLAPIVEIVSPHNLDWLTTPAGPAATLRVHCPPHSTTLLRTPRPVPPSPIVAPSQSTLAFGPSLTIPFIPCHNAILLLSAIHLPDPSFSPPSTSLRLLTVIAPPPDNNKHDLMSAPAGCHWRPLPTDCITLLRSHPWPLSTTASFADAQLLYRWHPANECVSAMILAPWFWIDVNYIVLRYTVIALSIPPGHVDISVLIPFVVPKHNADTTCASIIRRPQKTPHT